MSTFRSDLYDELKRGLEVSGLELSSSQTNQFLDYGEMLVEWNEKFNLTAILDAQGIAYKHFVDSLLILKYLDLEKGGQLLDVGTGAGFPGIPLKIAAPYLKVDLLDSLNKRGTFLKEVFVKLGLEEIDFYHARAEDLGQNMKFRQQYDFVCSRAVARLNVLIEWTLPFVKVGGTFFALKGSEGQEEVREATKGIETLGGKVIEVMNYTLPGFEDKRVLVIIKKEKETPKQFPRKPGKAKSHPL